MNKSFTLFALLAAAGWFGSCKAPHYLYAPSASYTPMLNKKGDMNATGMYAIGGLLQDPSKGYNRGYDFQAGYALSNHFALTAVISGRWEKNTYDSINNYRNSPQIFYKRHTTELGGGYFTPLNSHGTSYFDFYGGYGFGRYNMAENDLGSTPFNRFHNVSVKKLFFQPGFHFNFNGGQVGLNSRFTVSTYHNISTDYTADEQSSYDMDNIYKNVYVFWEPSFAMKLWVPKASWVRLNMQATFSALVSRPYIPHRSAYLVVGLSFDLPKLK